MILAEVGLNLAAFPSERHFVGWLGLASRTAASGASRCPAIRAVGSGQLVPCGAHPILRNLSLPVVR